MYKWSKQNIILDNYEKFVRTTHGHGWELCHECTTGNSFKTFYEAFGLNCIKKRNTNAAAIFPNAGADEKPGIFLLGHILLWMGYTFHVIKSLPSIVNFTSAQTRVALQ
jgi:hypothetical protein